MSKINPYDCLPERLHNCPNCGGTLQDDGKCRFCGSVVYDLVSIDLDGHKPVNMQNEGLTLYADNNPIVWSSAPKWEGSVDFDIVSDIIVEDTKVTGIGG